MKTPREILWQRHRSIEPKLDAVRQKALASLTPARTHSSRAALLRSLFARYIKAPRQRRPTRDLYGPSGRGLREMLLSFRWHLAGMSAAWILVAVLNIDHSASPVAAMDKERIPSPQQFLAAIRENRRQIAELLESPANVSEPSPQPASSAPKR